MATPSPQLEAALASFSTYEFTHCMLRLSPLRIC